MTLFTLAMNAFSAARVPVLDGAPRPFHKMMIFDEAHKYMGKGVLSADILKMVREMRHRQMWIVYASQDPESVHPALIKLASVLIVHQLKAQGSLKVLRENFAGCDLLAKEMALLQQGEARIMAVYCADAAYRMKPQPVYIRPTCARPGGTTRTAVP